MRPLVGLDLSGVTEGGDEYEVVASSSVGLGDWLRFYYSNERPELRFLAVVGGQPGGTPIVYLPFPGHGDESAAIEVGRFKKLPFEHRLKVLHTPGPLRLVALFTGRPVSRARLEALRAELLAEGSEEELREELGLEESDALHVLLTNVRGERALKQGVSEGNSRGRGVLLQNTPPRKRGEK